MQIYGGLEVDVLSLRYMEPGDFYFNQAISKLQCTQTASYMRKPQAKYETVIV